MKKHVPNFLTLMNLLSGVTAIIFLASGNIIWASYMVIIALVFDLFDGTSARLLKVSSPVGIELDSLADLVSFGVVPGLMVYAIINEGLSFPVNNYFALSGFLIPFFATVRLAKFNLSFHSQKDFFSGIPVPLAACFFVSIPLIVNEYGLLWLYNDIFLASAAIVFGLLMVSKVPVVSLKFPNFSFKDNRLRYFLFVSAVVAGLFIHFAAVPVIVLLTLFCSFFVINR